MVYVTGVMVWGIPICMNVFSQSIVMGVSLVFRRGLARQLALIPSMWIVAWACPVMWFMQCDNCKTELAFLVFALEQRGKRLNGDG